MTERIPEGVFVPKARGTRTLQRRAFREMQAGHGRHLAGPSDACAVCGDTFEVGGLVCRCAPVWGLLGVSHAS